MAFPYAEREYSLYTSSSNEGSIGRAQHDLDRCARILNEVLDNGAGILDGVKKRKSLTSPAKDTTNLQKKKLRQTNSSLLTTNKISSSTPSQTPLSQGRRHRSSSASSVFSSCKPHLQRRHRSLSEQRCGSVTGNSIIRGRERARSCSAQRHSSTRSVNSALANHSLTSSDADTLTGVHLDNSSQFGIPPVFNAKGEKRHGKDTSKARSSATRRTNMGWLKPQASASTQTAASDKENRPELIGKAQRRKRETKAALDTRRRSSSKAAPVRIPSVKDAVDQSDVMTTRQSCLPLSSLLTKSCSQRENDVDDLLERTLETEEISTQVGIEDTVEARSNTVNELMSTLRTAAQTHDLGWFDTELGKVCSALTSMLTDSKQNNIISVDALLVPFHREAKELRQQVEELKRQLKNGQDGCQSLQEVVSSGSKVSDNLLSRDLTVRVVAAESRNTQLSNELRNTMRELEVERRNVCRLTQSKPCIAQGDGHPMQTDVMRLQSGDKMCEDSASLELANERLAALQASVRHLHTRLSDIASCCDTDTSRELNSVLELCADALIASMRVSMHFSQVNRNNNSRWTDKPEKLAEVVSSNLIKSRTKGKIETGSNSEARWEGSSNRRDTDDTPSSGSSTAPNQYLPLLADGGKQESSGAEPTVQSKYEMSHLLGTSYHQPTAAVVSQACDRYAMPAGHYMHSTLNSTLNSDDFTLAEERMTSASVSSLSLGTTLADSAFQEGLAQLDYNIARLQASLKTSRFSSSM